MFARFFSFGVSDFFFCFCAMASGIFSFTHVLIVPSFTCKKKILFCACFSVNFSSLFVDLISSIWWDLRKYFLESKFVLLFRVVMSKKFGARRNSAQIFYLPTHAIIDHHGDSRFLCGNDRKRKKTSLGPVTPDPFFGGRKVMQGKSFRTNLSHD